MAQVGRVEANPEGKPKELQHFDHELSEREQEERLEEIQQYLRDREERLEIVETTTTPMDQRLHWIDRDSQVGMGKVADPPSEDQALVAQKEGEQEALPLTFELEQEGAQAGPPGTVPVVARPIDKIHPRGNLQDFLAKGNRPAPQPRPGVTGLIEPPRVGSPHEYAYSSHSGTCYGAQANINAWDPFVAYSDEFSLGQVAMAASSSKGMQTVEAGHQEYRDLYGNWAPHLFIYYTTTGYKSSGDKVGGYNRDVDGWIQYSSSIYPGALSSPLSSFGGAQYQMSVKYQLWQGNWWLRINGNWIGYYPAGLFSNPGLQASAASADWYGEIVDSDSHTTTTSTDMGSGNFASAGWQNAAYTNNIMYQSDTNGTMHDYAPASAWATRPGCYTMDSHFASGTSWGSYFWWGGPGRNTQCP